MTTRISDIFTSVTVWRINIDGAFNGSERLVTNTRRNDLLKTTRLGNGRKCMRVAGGFDIQDLLNYYS
jgi:hypothetical protein